MSFDDVLLVLGLVPASTVEATNELAKKQFRKLCLVHHPDRKVDGSDEDFKKLSAAYDAFLEEGCQYELKRRLGEDFFFPEKDDHTSYLWKKFMYQARRGNVMTYASVVALGRTAQEIGTVVGWFEQAKTASYISDKGNPKFPPYRIRPTTLRLNALIEKTTRQVHSKPTTYNLKDDVEPEHWGSRSGPWWVDDDVGD